ncbi:glycosyltransferase [Pseudomonas oryziphila]|uniref:Glycosyltransferase 2-like domain-containing protein n=1 Tax=Pseudomonas entomophila TaxID=312306 RepID=A0A3S8UGZ6_9PSED|nr:glycosyltransferase family 2 protein [Pseudomonas oryziphila]AZL67605.1 hypothetical protein EJA05_07525 [Pseudomonas oryziphila]
MSTSRVSFAFGVLVFNHESYIIEHLESIRYLIEQYGEGMDFQIIINDDRSKDRSVALVEAWLAKYANLFVSVDRLYNDVNLGTCASVGNMVDALCAKYFKLTAGDDVYSGENIFNVIPDLAVHSIVSGVPLDLTDGVISKSGFDVFHSIAADAIYDQGPLLRRFKGISVNNAPNIIYQVDLLRAPAVRRLLGQFDVVEDLPLQVAIAESGSDASFKLINKVFVYYRRTAGSTYLVATSRFFKDQIKMFEYLIAGESSAVKRFVLMNRMYCFKSGVRIVKRLCNIAVAIYGVKCMLKFWGIRERVARFESDLDLEAHVRHYALIKGRAAAFMNASFCEVVS